MPPESRPRRASTSVKVNYADNDESESEEQSSGSEVEEGSAAGEGASASNKTSSEASADESAAATSEEGANNNNRGGIAKGKVKGNAKKSNEDDEDVSSDEAPKKGKKGTKGKKKAAPKRVRKKVDSDADEESAFTSDGSEESEKADGSSEEDDEEEEIDEEEAEESDEDSLFIQPRKERAKAVAVATAAAAKSKAAAAAAAAAKKKKSATAKSAAAASKKRASGGGGDGGGTASGDGDGSPAPRKKVAAKEAAKGAKPALKRVALSRGKVARRGGDVKPEDLPVLSNPQDMFDDLVGRAPELDGFATAFARPLRVATMCSGTESPLLALGMIGCACREIYGKEFEVEHIFSCEIEPFKQAYIERNFAPPILFRDVTELGGKQATTAYGALADVPGGVDMLVAGTSCVDYSNLNNKKKGIEEGGQSGRTFGGMLDWVRNHRPPVVILENVCGAPWDKVVRKFAELGYDGVHIRLDTKFYYIPHTRQRGYFMAVRRSDKSEERLNRWERLVLELQRSSSAALEAFLLPTDDPRVHNAREDLAKPKSDRARPRTDWSRCEVRHNFARDSELLGTRRPLTGWQEGGTCRMPDNAWNDWGKSQPDRVLDLMDINYLRLARDGVDGNYKVRSREKLVEGGGQKELQERASAGL
ncbi:unnamed protein product [Phaeothamnion confervicola]